MLRTDVVGEALGRIMRDIRKEQGEGYSTLDAGAAILPAAFAMVLCAPIWAGKPACHLMTFLDAARLSGTRSALLFTTWGGGVEHTVDAMKGILEARGSQVVASESIMCRKVPEDILRARAREFALELKKRY